MRSPALMLSIALSSVAADGQVPPPIVDTSHSVIPYVRTMPSAGPPSGQVLVTWSVQNVRCDGVPIAFSRMPAPMPALAWSGIMNVMQAVDYSFTIDAGGRAGAITRRSTDHYAPGIEDLAPALAASQFAPGSPRGGCTVTFTLERYPVASAPISFVMAYTMFPQQQPTAEMWARTKPIGSTCFDPVPPVRTRVFPEFEHLPKQPGRQSWSMVGFDIDPSGRPIHVTAVTGNGNAALDAASLKAVAESRFAPGARTGCRYPYRLAAATLPPPPIPADTNLKPVDSTCPTEREWAIAPTLTYPPNFRRRSIEGWAIIGYDVAPWGGTGNVRVLAAEPAEDFGKEAVRIIATAKRVPSVSGYTGCTDRIFFRMGPTERQPGAPPVVFDPPQPAY